MQKLETWFPSKISLCLFSWAILWGIVKENLSGHHTTSHLSTEFHRKWDFLNTHIFYRVLFHLLSSLKLLRSKCSPGKGLRLIPACSALAELNPISGQPVAHLFLLQFEISENRHPCPSHQFTTTRPLLDYYYYYYYGGSLWYPRYYMHLWCRF